MSSVAQTRNTDSGLRSTNRLKKYRLGVLPEEVSASTLVGGVQMKEVRPRQVLREFRPRPRSEGMDFGLDKCLREVRASTGSLTVQSL